MRTLRDDSKLYEEPICELPLGSGQPIQGAPKAIGDEHGEKPPTDAILDGMTQGEALRLFRIACGTEDL